MDLERKAFERLKMGAEMSKIYYNKPLMICYSGGKDSDALVQLAINSGIEFEVLHNHTTADAPETVHHIREKFKKWELRGIKCITEYPTYKDKRVSMWTLIPLKLIPPMRTKRYCCEVLKERGGKNRAIATGVRWAESRARAKRGIYEDVNKNKDKIIILNNDNDDKRLLFERCQKQAKTVVNPIIDWKDSDVWDYIAENNVSSNPLYCEFSRVGCVGCPMAGKSRQEEFNRFSKYKEMYIHAFKRMLNARKERNLPTTWQSEYEVFSWWMEETPNKTYKG